MCNNVEREQFGNRAKKGKEKNFLKLNYSCPVFLSLENRFL